VKSADNRAAVLGALIFVITTFLGLLASWIGSQGTTTSVTFWVVLAFVGLLAVGAVIQFVHLRESRQLDPDEPSLVAPPGSTATSARFGRRQVPLFIGTVSGLMAGALLALILRPGIGLPASDPPTPRSSASASTTPSGPQTSSPAASTSGPASSLATVSTRPSAGAEYTDGIVVTVTVRASPPAGDTYWLMVVFRGGANLVYKAEAKIPTATGTYSFSISISGAAVGTTRTIYMLQADRQATPALQQNFDNKSPAWDGNRTSLPAAGAAPVSNSVSVTKQAA
jgi:hypothetical protein